VRIVVDTNVLISGIFFSGTPSVLVDACFTGEFELVVSPDVLAEYTRVGEEFTGKKPNVDFARFMELLVDSALLVEAPALDEGVCADPDDDKFIACAMSGGTKIITSGDKHLLAVSGYAGIEILRPRQVLEKDLD
jgi:putative PIN family toxin of toxin-antitoxin system